MGNDGRFRPWQQRFKDRHVEDLVLSFDPATDDHLPRAVTKLYPGETDVWVNLIYAQNGVKKSRATTRENPFLTQGGSFAPTSQVVTANSKNEVVGCFLPTPFIIRAHHV